MASTGEKIRLFQGLLNGEVATVGPFYVTVDVTRRCNLWCLDCRFHSRHTTWSEQGDPSVQDTPSNCLNRCAAT